MTPEAIGEAIGTVYHKAIQRLVPLLQAEPLDVEAIQTLHTAAISQLVTLGVEREKLDDEARGAVDDAAAEKIFDLDSELHEAFIAGQGDIEDSGLRSLVVSFGIITQYAFFELLRQQRPDEALRLGI